MQPADRGSWTSRMGFILAAAGSAVGIGNIWRFPYITGEFGGGLFILVYVGCILLISLPIMIAEFAMGRRAERSVVGAFRRLGGPAWTALGWWGVAASALVLSFYSVVGGWILHYTAIAARGAFSGKSPDQIAAVFGQVNGSIGLNLWWHAIFMALTGIVVAAGVQKGLERLSKWLMPGLLLMLAVLLVKAVTMSGFGPAMDFVFGIHPERLTGSGILAALGQAFFTLGVGVGGMLTYGSYLKKDVNIVTNTGIVCLCDTLIAVLACVVLFPIIFSFGMQPDQGPGLVFINLPVAFAQMPAGSLLATVFFLLLVFATVTSAVSLLEIATSYLIDERGWSRARASLAASSIIFAFGVPSALSGGTELFGNPLVLGRNWFGMVADATSNLMLPLGGLAMAIFAGWVWRSSDRESEFLTGGNPIPLYRVWVFLLRVVVPLAVTAVLLNALGVF